MTENQDTTKKEGESENVCVAIRIRPLNSKEIENKCPNVTAVDQFQNVIVLNNPKSSEIQQKIFQYDNIFTEGCTQMDMYKGVAFSIVQQIFEGYNGTIFAYGQTGSGKTYTMTGNEDNNDLKGIIPNTFAHIFSQISQSSDQKTFVVTATYLEIYNEEVRDLLSKTPDQKLPVRERTDIGVYVQGLTGFTVDSTEAISRLMKLGNVNRKTRATSMNDVSSRSHAIFSVTIETKTQQDKSATVAKLNLVDLAGSERLNRSHATGDGLRETSNINQSLFVLSNVISALVEGKTTHIPYRNSKLTRLLQNSLGGNSKTTMIATISPSAMDYDETLCTLRYASRAKLIKNYVQLNIHTNNSVLERLQQQLHELQKQLAALLLSEEEMLKKDREQRKIELKAKKRLELDSEYLSTENTKIALVEKLDAIDKMLITGGEHSEKIITNEKKSTKNVCSNAESDSEDNSDLYKQKASLEEEEIMLDEKIAKVEAILQKTKAQRDDENQQHKAELDMLFENSRSKTNYLKCMLEAARKVIPQQHLLKIDSNIVWNEDTCEHQIKGIAYAGNNFDTNLKHRINYTSNPPLAANLALRKRNRKLNLLKHKTRDVYKTYSDVLL